MDEIASEKASSQTADFRPRFARKVNVEFNNLYFHSKEIVSMKPIRMFAALFAVAVATTFSAPVADAHCWQKTSCCAAPCDCCTPPPPPPVKVSWCVCDPCTGCKYPVSACVPACCQGVTPCLDDCRKGILGRKILTYKFPCCGHCVEVVLTKRGRTIVRD